QALGILGGVVDGTQSKFFLENFSCLSRLGIPITFLWGPTFYFYVKSFAFSDFKLEWKHLLHTIPALMVFLYFLATYYPLNVSAKLVIVHTWTSSRVPLPIAVIRFLQILIYNFASLHVLKNYSEELKENFSSMAQISLSWLRLLIISFIAAYSISVIGFFLYLGFLSYWYPVTLFVDFVYFVFFNIIFFKGWHQQEIFNGIEERKKYQSSNLTSDEAQALIEKINAFVEQNKPHLIPGLTINQMAKKMNLPMRTLSQIINEYFGQNFYDYINKLRIEEAKRILREQGCKKTVLEVLYEIGYNSKSSFNAEFKKATGLTPTEFRRQTN
ncbi:MAG: helix-turn-helix domain-containing protein, partial [Candidatus Kryptoniota bacterium]